MAKIGMTGIVSDGFGCNPNSVFVRMTEKGR